MKKPKFTVTDRRSQDLGLGWTPEAFVRRAEAYKEREKDPTPIPPPPGRPSPDGASWIPAPEKEFTQEEKIALIRRRFHPTPRRYIVLEDEFHYGGQIHIPDSAKNHPTSGTVVSVGDDCKIMKAGDRVLYAVFSGTILPLREARVRVMTEEETLAKIMDCDQLEFAEVK